MVGTAGVNSGATTGKGGAANGGAASTGGVGGAGGNGSLPETCPPPLELAPLASVHPLENSCWKSRASSCAPNVGGGNSPGYALDGDLDTRLSTGSYMNAGTAFEYRIDLRSLVNVERVTLTSKADDWARELSVYASADGLKWRPVACGPGGLITDFWFEVTAARYLKFVQGGGEGGWWSLHEIVVYGDGKNTCEHYVGPRDPGTCDSIHFND
jgi:hypothetical protein